MKAKHKVDHDLVRMGELVQGTVDRAVADLGVFKRRWDGQAARLLFRVVQVRSRQHHVLTGAEPLTGEGADGAEALIGEAAASGA